MTKVGKWLVVKRTCNVLQLSSHGYLRWAGGSTFNQGRATGYSFGSLFSIPGAFRFARLFFYNLGGVPANVGRTVLIGPSARNDHLAPVDAEGNYLTDAFIGWQTVGFDQGSMANASAINATFHPINGDFVAAQSVSIPPASGLENMTWGKSWTDWAQIAPVPPKNGGLYHYLVALVDVDASFSHGAFGPSFNQVDKGYNRYSPDLGKVMRGAFLQGVQGGQPTEIDKRANAGSAFFGSPLVCGVEVLFEKKALTIVSVGDSLGDNPYQGLYNGAEAAAAYMTRDSGLPVCSFNMCHSAYPVQEFARLAIAELSTLPSAGVILIQCQSGNLDNQNTDGNEMAFSKVQLGFVLDLAERAEGMGIFVVIVGPCPAMAPQPIAPANLPTAAQIAAHNTFIAVCQEIAAEAKMFGYTYLDRDVIWGYGDGSMRQDPKWWDENTHHPTPAALQHEGRFIQTLLTPLLPDA